MIIPKQITKQYIVCPHCNQNSGHSVDHIQRGGHFGEWYCNECGHSYKGCRNEHGQIELTLSDSVKTNTYDLVVLPPQDKPIYFVLKGMSFNDGHYDDGKEYFYEEHSCPTNWLKHMVTMIIENDDDPHGLIEFVRSVKECDAPLDDDPHAYKIDAFKVFPEVLQSYESRR